MSTALTKLLQRFGYEDKKVFDYINNQIIPPELSMLSQRTKRIFVKLTFETRQKLDIGYQELLKGLDKKLNKKISYEDFYNNTITIKKEKRKLFKFLLNNRIFNQREVENISAWSLPKKELWACLSVNYSDFLLCSTENDGWTSCLDLINGDYAVTLLGSFFDPSRAIFFITDKVEKECYGFKSYNMYLRAWIYICNKELRFPVIYPGKYSFTIPKEIFGTKIEPLKRHDVTKYPINIFLNRNGIMFQPYLDRAVLTKRKDGMHICFNDSSGSYFIYKNKYGTISKSSMDSFFMYIREFKYIKSSDDLFLSHCDGCGKHHILVETLGKTNYCPSCRSKTMFKCAHCGREHIGTQIEMTTDGKLICRSCIKKLGYSKCSQCKQYFLGEGKTCNFCDYLHESDRCSQCKRKIYSNDIFGTIFYDKKKKNCYKITEHRLLCYNCKTSFFNEHYEYDYDLDCYTTKEVA
jgi:hypothetical protein